MTRLSIIIPAGNDVSSLEDTLVSVLANRPRECEVLVPHAGSYDDPYELHDEVRFLQMPSGADAAVLVAKACNMAGGRLIHLLAPGHEVDDGWCDEASEALKDRTVAAVSPVIVGTADSEIIESAGVAVGLAGRRMEVGRGLNIESSAVKQLHPVGPTARAAFYRRDALDCIGGWPTAVGPKFADLDVALSLTCLGFQCVVSTSSHVVSRGRRENRTSAFSHSRSSERLFLRHRFSTISNLARPLFALGECLAAGGPLAMSLAAAGKCAAVLDVASCRRHADWLEAQRGIAGTIGQPDDTAPITRRAA